jgi:predicted DNA-binding mobile mystery protein A
MMYSRLEASERNQTIRLDTLARAAEAMDCELVYALVPRKPLEELVTEQAGRKASEQLRRLGHTMALEQQGLDDDRLKENYQVLLEHFRNSPGLWHSQPLPESSSRAKP